MLKRIFATIATLLIGISMFVPIAHAQIAQSTASSNISLYPATGTFDNNTQFQVDIKLVASSLSSAKVVVDFDSNVLSVQTIANGSMFSAYDPSGYDNTAGTLTLSASSAKVATNANGIFGTVTFLAKNIASSTNLTVDQASTNVKDATSLAIAFQSTNATLSISSTAAPAPTSNLNLPKTGIVEDLITPLIVAWVMIIGFLTFLYFRSSKDDVMKRVLTRQKK